MRKGLYILSILLGCAGWVHAQSAEVQPPALRRIPVAGVGEGRYWQQLVITLDQDDAPGDSALTVHLPLTLKVLDTSGEGRVDDEVRVVYVSAGSEAPDFFVSPELTTEDLIVLGSRQPAGAGGKVYVQFPVSVGAIPDVPAVGYGPITFGDERELDLETGPELNYFHEEDFATLGSMQLVELGPVFAAGADTSTSAVGTTFPDAPEVLVLNLPDLVFDGGVSTRNALLGPGNGDDRDDVGYRFHFSTSEGLESIGPDVAQEARRADETVYAEREGTGGPVQLLTRDLPEGRYFLYVTADVIGGLVLGKSRAVQVRHSPRVEQVGSVDGTVELDSGVLEDSEGRVLGQGPHQVELEFSVVDHDDVPAVQLYYSEVADLGALDLVLSDGAVGLDRAVAITAGLQQREGNVQWDILTPQVVPAGSYYIYALASDGRNHTLGRSQEPIQVRHAPYLRLDPLDDQGIGADPIATGGLRPQRYLTFTWGRSGSDGDQDVDGDARIDLYYSTTPARAGTTAGFAIPEGAAELLADVGLNTQPIAIGLAEDPDQRQDNQYTWDLWALAREGKPVPGEGQVYYVYGIISDGTSQRLAQMNGGRLNDPEARLVFAHAPALRPLQPLAETLVRPGRTGRVSWEDMDLDHNARIRVLLSPTDWGAVSDYAAVYSGATLVANSAGGQPAAAVDPVFDLSEDSGVDYYDLSTAAFPIPDGLYYVYLAAEDKGSFGSGSRAWRTPGQVRVEGSGEAAAEAFRLFPQIFSMGSGQRQVFELRVDAAGQLVDLVLVTLKVDGGAFAAVDQDSTAEGVQPFAAAGNFSAAQLIGNQASAQEDGSLLLSLAYFDPTGGVAGLDGRGPLVRLELEALEREGQVQVQLVADGGGGRVSRLDQNSRPVLIPPDQVLAEGTVVAGRVLVRGRLLLEGHQQGSARVSCALRPWGQYTPLVDEVFAAANDADAEQEGVQVELQADGSFELKQVSPGRLDLHFHRDGYLDAWAPGLELYPGQPLEGVEPSTPGADQLMLGGDVAGYLELDGTSRPDNEVTLADWDFAAGFFGADLSGGGEGLRADITGDGQVDVRDLALVGANFLGRGPRPVYKANRAQGPVQLVLRLDALALEVGQEVSLTVEGTGLEAVHAAQVELRLPAGQWEWVRLPAPAGEGLVAYYSEAGRTLVGMSRQGPQAGFGPVLLEGRLRALQAQPERPSLGRVLLLDAAHQSLSLQGGEVLPGEYALLQNYPNPFNPETTIEFTLPARGTARLEIFDALGQRVALLWDGPLAAGRHRLQWEGRDEQGRLLGSGVYFYRLHSGELNRVRRMVLLR
ncbi:MAG: T9SS type A sorting domain-containing protein [Candidatus Latescibacteria bacterium]|nr:T9SS type A sorting domain-containing protein [Candidatus Latescibacterota bacterium]